MRTPQFAKITNKITAAASNKQGGTIVGVLVAATFVGVVVAFMLKSTGSQAATVTAHETLLLSNISASSGVVASESYFENPNPAVRSKVLNIISDFAKTKSSTPVPLIRGSDGKRFKLADKQFFNSDVAVEVTGMGLPTQKIVATFDIDGGTRPGGAGISRAWAQYEVKNVEFVGTPSGAWTGSNALYVGGGHGNVVTDARLEIHGSATFAGTELVTFNSQTDSIKFMKDANGQGDVFFNGPVTTTKNVGFDVKAYFNGYLGLGQLPNGSNVFKDDVGFRANVTASTPAGAGAGVSIGFDGDIWMGGNIADNSGNVGSNIEFAGDPSKTLHHSSNLRLQNLNSPTSNKTTIPPTQFRNYPGGLDSATIINGLGINHLENRREPTLNISVAAMAARGKKFIDLPGAVLGNSSFQVWESNSATISTVKSAINALPAADRDQYYDESGHLLIRVTGGLTPGQTPLNLSSEKVIFYVDNGNNQFGLRIEGTTANTLVYVAPTGGTLGMTFMPNSTFNGLIYVEEGNAKNHIFNAGEGSSINGALLMKGGNMRWNDGNVAGIGTTNNRMTIRKDDAYLSEYGYLIGGSGTPGGSTGGNVTAQVVTDSTIRVNMLGIYYW